MPHLRPLLSLNLMLPTSFSTPPLSSSVLNDFERLCSERSLQQTNQRGQCTFVPPVNLLYLTAINVSVDQVIKPRHFVCFISGLTGMGNSDAHTHARTHTRINCIFISERFPLFFWWPRKGPLISVPVITHSTGIPLQNFIFSSSCGKTQLDSKITLCPSSQLVTTAMCLPDVEDVSHLSMCLYYSQNLPHGKLTLFQHINVFFSIYNTVS